MTGRECSTKGQGEGVSQEGTEHEFQEFTHKSIVIG